MAWRAVSKSWYLRTLVFKWRVAAPNIAGEAEWSRVGVWYGSAWEGRIADIPVQCGCLDEQRDTKIQKRVYSTVPQ